jgi:hypothetical protein
MLCSHMEKHFDQKVEVLSPEHRCHDDRPLGWTANGQESVLKAARLK